MDKIYIGPLWGNLEWTSNLKTLSFHNEFTFFGGYQFFGEEGFLVVSELQKLSKVIKTNFNLSRFEEAFLISSNLQDELEFHFRRWLNPLSGILSAVESYDIDPLLALKDPENLFNHFDSSQSFQCHRDFFLHLEKIKIPEIVTSQIEKSILDKSAFQTLSIYSSDGNVITSFDTKQDLAGKYIRKTFDLLEKYASGK